MSEPPLLFDRRLLRQRRARFAAALGREGDTTFDSSLIPGWSKGRRCSWL